MKKMTEKSAKQFCDDYLTMTKYEECVGILNEMASSPVYLSDITGERKVHLPFELAYHFRRLLVFYLKLEIKVIKEKLGLSDEKEVVSDVQRD